MIDHPLQNAQRWSTRCSLLRGVAAWSMGMLILLILGEPSAAQQVLSQPMIPTPPPMLGGASETYDGPPLGIDGPARLKANPARNLSSQPRSSDELPPPVDLPPAPRTERSAEPLRTLPGIDGDAVTEGFPANPFELGEGEPLVVDGDILEGDVFYPAESKNLSDYRNGFFQKLALSGNWIAPGDGGTDIGSTEIDTYLTVALPFPIVEWPLLISPGYNMILLEGPTTEGDLPPRLNAAYVDFTWLPTVLYRNRLLLAVTPGVYSDFEASNSDALRITGKAILIHDLIPDKLQLVGGVIYLDRDNLKMLPAGGAIWTPTDWFLLEALFPKPKLAVRWNVGQGFEDWLFFTAEFGGNTYSIIRDGGEKDSVTYADYRLISGIERKLNGGAGYRFEAAYLFGRDVEYLSGNGNFSPGDTFMLRAGITF